MHTFASIEIIALTTSAARSWAAQVGIDEVFVASAWLAVALSRSVLASFVPDVLAFD